MWSSRALALILLTSSPAWSATTAPSCAAKLGRAPWVEVELAEVMADGSPNPMMPTGDASDPKGWSSWEIDRAGLPDPATIEVVCRYRGTRQTATFPVPADAKLCRFGPGERQITCQ